MDPLLQIKDLTVKFYTPDGAVQALENLNLDIQDEETFGLVGETGSGKTLTSLAILRLIPPPGKIESGTISFNPRNGNGTTDLLHMSEKQIRRIRGRQIAMVFQEPGAALNPVYTIGDQIAEVVLEHRQRQLAQAVLNALDRLPQQSQRSARLLKHPARTVERMLYMGLAQAPATTWARLLVRLPVIRGVFWRLKGEAAKTAISALKEVEISDPERIMRQYPHQLSGGMKQRCVIAMALACHPRFLIADEPTTALDVTIQAQILELLRQLKVEEGASILYITHDLAVAAEICDRIGVMYAGTLCEVAPVSYLYANPAHPYTRALMAAVPRPGEEPHPILGAVPDPFNLPSGCRFHPRCNIATGICEQQAPLMQQIAPGHFVACHLCEGEAHVGSG